MRSWFVVVTVLLLSVGTAAADKAKDAVACDRGELKACERSCKDGDGVSCTERGLLAVVNKDPAKAKASFEVACRAGETYGCKLVAQLFEAARPQDLAQAAATYRKACALGSETACARVGMSKEEKVAAVSYPVRLVEAIRAACTAKHMASCTELGAMYILGRGVAKDESTGMSAFDTACAAGELWACSNLGINFGNAKDTAAMGLEFLDKACTGGIAHACFNLGIALYESKFLPADKPRAFKMFDRACTLGHALGCNALGRMYAEGEGVAKDPARAEQLFKSGCAAQAANACVELGRMRDGDHGPADYKVAIEAYTVACERGNPGGCMGLALMHHQARGVPEDFAKARELYARACAKRNGNACNNLGVLVESGKGGAADEVKAIDAYRQGCDADTGTACMNLARKTTDKAKQLVLYDKGCTLGEKSACAAATSARK
ncbi:MAG: sel1 repeat family protein [Myxococcales bacterium]|nr:sel1 repeat family protein [Myxococcales bacterium]